MKNTTTLTIALVFAATVGAQTQETVDATARGQAAQVGQIASKAAIDASTAAGQAKAANEANSQQNEKIDAIDGKLSGLEESFLETKSTVDGLKKLKIGGLAQVRYYHYTDTNLVGTKPYQQDYMAVRRGRLKATYDAGNGSSYVMQFDIKEKGLSAQDLYARWEEPWLKVFSIQGGMQDIPFGYEAGYSSSTMEWLERSNFERSTMLKDEKDVGVVLGIAPSVPGLDAFQIKLAYLNGYGLSGSQPSGQQDPRNFVGRLTLSKDLTDIGVGVNLGASYFQDQRIVMNKGGVYYKIDGSADFLKTNALSKELSSSLIGVDAQITADVSMVPGLAGAKFMGELYTGNANGVKGNNLRSVANSDTLYQRNTLGWYVAYVQNIGKSFQTVVRYDVYDPNTDVSGDEIGDKKANSGKGNGTSKTDIEYDTWYFGLNWFATSNMKFTIGYDLVRNETSTNLNSSVAASNLSQEIKDDFVTLQGQFAF